MSTKEEVSKSKFYYGLIVAMSSIALIAVIHFLEYNGLFYSSHFGLRPKNPAGIIGILTMPFLHSSWEHLANNSVSLFVLTISIFYFYRELAWKTILFIVFAGGLWLWLAGIEGTNHIGASGLVYGLAGFLFVSGLIRKNKNLMGISLLVIFLYGSFFWGALPFEQNIAQNISWDGHLYGALAGIAIAIYYRKDGPQRTIYQYEIDEMLEEEERKRMEELQKILEDKNANVRIIYHYKKQSESDNEDEDKS